MSPTKTELVPKTEGKQNAPGKKKVRVQNEVRNRRYRTRSRRLYAPLRAKTRTPSGTMACICTAKAPSRIAAA